MALQLQISNCLNYSTHLGTILALIIALLKLGEFFFSKDPIKMAKGQGKVEKLNPCLRREQMLSVE